MRTAGRIPDFPVKTLVVDDAPLIRRAIHQILDQDERIRVVGTAVNGQDALKQIPDLQPDVITLDIDMPIMNGITAVKHIMVRHQIPVVMVSSMIQDGYFAFEALRLGVVDFVPKPSRVSSSDWGEQEELLRQRVIMGASMQVNRMRRVRRRKRVAGDEPLQEAPADAVVLMGTTLAGPNSVMRVVSDLSPGFPAAVVVLQEIHPRILVPFSEYFNEISPLGVVPVTGVHPLLSGRVYMASTFQGLVVEEDPEGESNVVLRATEAAERPIDGLFESGAFRFKNRTCAVLLTGTGIDGTEGMQQVKEKGGFTVGQEQDCSVYPNLVEHAIRRNAVDALVADHLLASLLVSWAEAGSERVRYAALYDPLTDLPNRSLLLDRLQQAMARSNRYRTKVAVLLLALDRLKAIYGDWGEETGDLIVKEVVNRLRGDTRSTDTVSRTKVDEFAIILEDMEKNEDIASLAERILGSLAAPFEMERETFTLGVQLGISLYPADGATADSLFQRTALALGNASSKGENSYAYYRADMLSERP